MKEVSLPPCVSMPLTTTDNYWKITEKHNFKADFGQDLKGKNIPFKSQTVGADGIGRSRHCFKRTGTTGTLGRRLAIRLTVLDQRSRRTRTLPVSVVGRTIDSSSTAKAIIHNTAVGGIFRCTDFNRHNCIPVITTTSCFRCFVIIGMRHIRHAGDGTIISVYTLPVPIIRSAIGNIERIMTNTHLTTVWCIKLR